MKFSPQPKSVTIKKTPKPLKRVAIKYKPKNSGQVSVFEEIAEERDWICFVTKEPLRELTATQFMHVLPKALNKYPKYKTYKRNIVLAKDEIHDLWDKAPRSKIKNDPRFKELFLLEAELIKSYPITL